MATAVRPNGDRSWHFHSPEAEMSKAKTHLHDEATLFGRLRSACFDDWEAYCGHEFVRRLGDGTLPEECFRHYLEQDYLFLIHFARAWALAVYKADNLEDMRSAVTVLHATLTQEMALHVKYCAGWGIDENRIETIPEAKANMAYTRFVLERGLAGDILDLRVALSPCTIGYAEIGQRLKVDPNTRLEGNRYRDWIDMYSSDEIRSLAQEEIGHIDRLAAARFAKGRFDDLVDTFRKATRLEVGFWDMGLKLET
jgi:thiaminase/transcriptional activator TenA